MCDPVLSSGGPSSFQKSCGILHCRYQTGMEMNFKADVSLEMTTSFIWCYWTNKPRSKHAIPNERFWAKNSFQISFSTDYLKKNGAPLRSRRLNIPRRYHTTPPLVPTAGENCHQQLLLQRSGTSIDQTMRVERQETSREQRKFLIQ